MKEIYIIRHGFRLDHEDKSWKATAERPFDAPLAEKGHLQAKKTAVALKNAGIEAIYSSPLKRAIQTATHVADYLDLPINLESGIVEWLNPKWYDYTTWRQPVAERLEEFPRINPDYKSLVEPQYPEHHEAIPWSRGAYTARYLAHAHEGPILLVSHGVVVVTLAEALTGTRKGVSDKTCSISHYKGSGYDWNLVSSSTDHLEKDLEEESADFV